MHLSQERKKERKEMNAEDLHLQIDQVHPSLSHTHTLCLPMSYLCLTRLSLCLAAGNFADGGSYGRGQGQPRSGAAGSKHAAAARIHPGLGCLHGEREREKEGERR